MRIAPKFLKQTLASTGIAVVLLGISACGGNTEVSTQPDIATTPATVTAAPTETPASVETQDPAHNGIPVKGPAQNVNGKYLQTTLKLDDPIIATFDPKSATGDAVSAFTEDELREAVKVAQVFVAEEGIDSIINGSNDPADVDAWWAANKDKFTAKLQSQAYDYVKANKSLVVRTAGDTAAVNNIQYWYDENSTRVQIRENTIKSVEVSSQWPNSVGVDTNLNYIIWGKDEAGNKYPINVSGNYYLNLKKDEATGDQWLIDGQSSKYDWNVANK